MAEENKNQAVAQRNAPTPNRAPTPAPPPTDARKQPDTFKDLEKAAKKGSLLDKFSSRLSDAIHSSRGDDWVREPNKEIGDDTNVTADDLAIRRAKSVNAKRMVVPEGVIINGSLISSSETEISGKVDGNVSVEGRLYRGPSALITGNVRAVSCRVDGLVEGKMECSHELDLGETGRLNADVLSGRNINLAGQVRGNVSCGGMLRIVVTAQVRGNVRAKRLYLEEGAQLNGKCTMRTPVEKRSNAQ